MKSGTGQTPGAVGRSPSVRRAWIEITSTSIWSQDRKRSPSVRRAWIEMFFIHWEVCQVKKSPSVRRAWIEISVRLREGTRSLVALREEGVD